MLLPGLAMVTGIAVPAGWVTETQLLSMVRNPLVRLLLVSLVFLFSFHWAHRFRYALVDLGLRRLGEQAWLFYGVAAIGTILAGIAAVTL